MGFSWIISILINPQWVAAIATFLAVFVALFKDDIIKPRIKFGISNHRPHVIQLIGKNGMPAKLFRLRIINEGRVMARNCHIKVISILSKDGKSSVIEPDNLKWSSAPRDMAYRVDPPKDIRNISDTNQLTPIYREKKDISPKGGWEFCDLMEISSGNILTLVSYGNRDIPANFEDYYVITLEVSGDNVKTREIKFKISNPSDFEKIRIEDI